MRIYLILLVLTISLVQSLNFNKRHEEIIFIQKDSIKIFKKYRSTLNNSKVSGLSETLKLSYNHEYDYKVKVGMIRRNSSGNWKLINNHLILIDKDTSKLIYISELTDKQLPNKIIRFEILEKNSENIGYSLKISFKNGGKLLLDTTKSKIEIMGGNIKSFDISSVIPLESFYPKKGSNYFKIIINSNKTFFKNKWRVDGQKLYSDSNELNCCYYLEEF